MGEWGPGANISCTDPSHGSVQQALLPASLSQRGCPGHQHGKKERHPPFLWPRVRHSPPAARRRRRWRSQCAALAPAPCGGGRERRAAVHVRMVQSGALKRWQAALAHACLPPHGSSARAQPDASSSPGTTHFASLATTNAWLLPGGCRGLLPLLLQPISEDGSSSPARRTTTRRRLLWLSCTKATRWPHAVAAASATGTYKWLLGVAEVSRGRRSHGWCGRSSQAMQARSARHAASQALAAVRALHGRCSPSPPHNKLSRCSPHLLASAPSVVRLFSRFSSTTSVPCRTASEARVSPRPTSWWHSTNAACRAEAYMGAAGGAATTAATPQRCLKASSRTRSARSRNLRLTNCGETAGSRRGDGGGGANVS